MGEYGSMQGEVCANWILQGRISFHNRGHRTLGKRKGITFVLEVCFEHDGSKFESKLRAS